MPAGILVTLDCADCTPATRSIDVVDDDRLFCINEAVGTAVNCGGFIAVVVDDEADDDGAVVIIRRTVPFVGDEIVVIVALLRNVCGCVLIVGFVRTCVRRMGGTVLFDCIGCFETIVEDCFMVAVVGFIVVAVVGFIVVAVVGGFIIVVVGVLEPCVDLIVMRCIGGCCDGAIEELDDNCADAFDGIGVILNPLVFDNSLMLISNGDLVLFIC